MCSTPYGIKGLITFVGLRLTAPPFVCSTPYGIKGLITRNKDKTHWPLVLRAQRLTASKV